MNRKKEMIDHKGFTLIEALMVLVIVSIVSALAYPSLIKWKQRAGFRSEVSTLVAWLHRAKTEAIKTNSAVVVKPDSKGYTIFVDNSSVPGNAKDWIWQSEERKLVSYKLKYGLTLLNNFTNNRMRFNTQPGMKAGTFTLKDFTGNHMDIVVSIIGRIRVE